MSVLKAAALYFAAVFGVGFGLGVVRVLWLAPNVGERAAELIELPVMVAVVAAVARWRQRSTPALGPVRQLAVGGVALALLLAAELAVGAARGRSPAAVLLERDPVAGPAYFAALAAFALAPWAWALRARRRRGRAKQIR